MKTTLFAVVAAVAITGCGIPGPISFDSAGSDTAAARTQAAADLWARSAYAFYGADAVETCLSAFHAERNTTAVDPVEPGSHQARASYREQLADFMCACARGQSTEACPVP